MSNAPVSTNATKQPAVRRPERRLQQSVTATGPYADILALHRMIGNQAVMRLLQPDAPPDGVPSAVQQVVNGGGQPLDAATRDDMESRFDQDFSQVRIHTDAQATESAQAVNANAYTVGRDVVFGAGRFAPGTPSGKLLLAHELAHVVQQGRGGALPSLISGSPLEQAANQAAVAATTGSGPVTVAGGSAPGLARQEQEEKEGPGFWGTIGGGLLGEFEEDPSLGMIGVDLGVSLIPILDQVSDARDIAAHIYFMAAKDEYKKPMRWVGLVFSLIGLFPEIGSAIKSASKLIIKGVREVLNHLGDILRVISRVLPDMGDIGRFQAYLARHWDQFMAFGKRAWESNIGKVMSWLNRGRLFLGGLAQRLLDNLRVIREMSASKLGEAFASAKRQIDNVIEQVKTRLGRQSDEVTPPTSRSTTPGTQSATAPPGPATTTATVPPGRATQTTTAPPASTGTPRARPAEGAPAAAGGAGQRRETVEEFLARGGTVKKLPPGPPPRPQVTRPSQRPGRGSQSALGEGPETRAVNESTPARAGMARLPQHHVFPQEHRAWFEARGFKGEQDIDRFTVRLGEGEHQAIHGGGNWRVGRTWSNEWNQRIMRELENAERLKGSKLTVREIWEIGTRLMREYQIPREFIPY